MRIIITPTYKELFTGDRPDLKELLFDIPSMSSLTILCSINSKLFLSKSLQSQIEIFQLITRKVPEKDKRKFLENIAEIQAKDLNQEIQFFSTLATLEFIHYELINYKKIPFENKDLNGDQELRFLKAYFIIVQRINDKYESVFGKSLDKGEFFHTAMWPTFIEQLEINHTPNPVNALIRSLIFFNYFDKNEDLKKFLKIFIQFHDREHYWDYSKILMNLLRINWEGERKDYIYGNFLIKGTKELKTLLQNFTLNIENYQQEYGDSKKSYIGLKEEPFIPYDKNQYLISNWNFIINKVYEGLIFDFYKHSGIKKEKFKSFPDFKNFVAQEITEKYLFQTTLRHYLNKNYSILNFDGAKDKGHPDAYYRIGKYIFLFEIKDAFFPSKAISSNDYEVICQAIDEKYNNKRKGTGQIIKQLNHLTKSPFESKSYQELNLKTRNLIIYPIVIYTDNFFSMPGINRYLNQAFRKKLKEQNCEDEFGKVENLLFMNISFLLNQIHKFKKFDLKQILDEYFKAIHNSEKRFNKRHFEKDMQGMNINFEQFVAEKYSLEQNDGNYLQTIFEIFEMRKYFA